jgi:hypothetical protein
MLIYWEECRAVANANGYAPRADVSALVTELVRAPPRGSVDPRVRTANTQIHVIEIPMRAIRLTYENPEQRHPESGAGTEGR